MSHLPFTIQVTWSEAHHAYIGEIGDLIVAVFGDTAGEAAEAAEEAGLAVWRALANRGRQIIQGPSE